MLRDLAELGMVLAREVQQQALRQTSAPARPDAPQPGLLFTRLARAIRQTIALDAHIAAGLTAASATAQARRNATDRRRKRLARNELRIRLEQAVDADPDARSDKDSERLLADLVDRLDDDDIEAALITTPVCEIVVSLCREFGVAADLSHWTDEELAAAIAREDARCDPPDPPRARWPRPADPPPPRADRLSAESAASR